MSARLKVFTLFMLVALLSLQGCLVTEQKFSAIPPGQWRGMLYLGNNPNPNAISMGTVDADNKLLFNFDVQYITPDSFVVYVINGTERILINELSFGHNRATGRDSLVLNFPEFDSYIKAYYEEDILEGRWYVPSKGDYSIPFLARNGLNGRFPHEVLDVQNDVSGKWEVAFGLDTDEPWPAVGEFKQNGRQVTGTFLTETGDYRFLDGIVDGYDLWLSAFDGAHAFLFKAKITGDSMTGFFKSGNHYQTIWEARKNDGATIKDAMELTTFEPADRLNFSFYQGDTVVRFEDAYPPSDNPKVVQIMGTWCPNCKDETVFLRDYYNKGGNEIEILSFGFERTEDPIRGIEILQNYKEKMNVPYPMHYAGKSSKKLASEVFAQLSGITSFPTLIFLKSDHSIYKIHTGFSGPATSEYDKFKEEFYRTIEELVLDSTK